MKRLAQREKGILCGLFFSKFNSSGLDALGFSSFKEAYNVLGLALDIKPASIKNYRDELDPLFPNGRMGWHKRAPRESSMKVYNEFSRYELNELKSLISNITGCKMSSATSDSYQNTADTFARRLATGKAAENYFINHYQEDDEFRDCFATDVTNSGCGYDFHLFDRSRKINYAIEVKGMRQRLGSISMTNKEYEVANHFRNYYYLYVVKNFEDVPFAVKYQNPVNAGLPFSRHERKIVQISWLTKI